MSAKSNTPSFEEKLAQLEEIVAWFESDEVTLDESMKRFEQGMKLAETLEKELEAAGNKIEVIKQKFSGKPI